MEKKKLTTASGIPYTENENTMSVGQRGPLLLQDFILHEKWLTLTVNVFRKE
jgi:catalase